MSKLMGLMKDKINEHLLKLLYALGAVQVAFECFGALRDGFYIHVYKRIK
jgi:hypothetical protein